MCRIWDTQIIENDIYAKYITDTEFVTETYRDSHKFKHN